jgi:hypothetical protein
MIIQVSLIYFIGNSHQGKIQDKRFIFLLGFIALQKNLRAFNNFFKNKIWSVTEHRQIN